MSSSQSSYVIYSKCVFPKGKVGRQKMLSWDLIGEESLVDEILMN